MKKLLSLLSVITITGATMPTLIAASPSPCSKITQEQKTKLLNTKTRIKRNFVDDWLQDLQDFRLSDSELRDLHNAYDPVETDVVGGIIDSLTAPTITNTVEKDGGKFTFEWKFYKLFYWTLKMDHKACEVLKNLIYSPEGGTAVALSGVVITSIFQGAGVLSTTGFGTLAVLSTAAPLLNTYLIYRLIQECDKGNGIRIGFWINQPGIGWGSL